MADSLRMVFAGTPDFAASALQALLDAGHEIVAVYSQPDRPAGRGRKLRASPVKELALQHEIPVYQPESLKAEEAQQELAALAPDLMIVAAYGLILPQAVLDIPRLGCLNIHASLLPRWRGAAPIQRAILAGDTETGITIMQMDAGLDTGDMLLKASTPIATDETGGSLHDRLAILGGEAIVQALQALQDGKLKPETQDDNLACYAHKLDKTEARIDWQQPAEQILRLIRAFNPWPVAFTEANGNSLRIWSAEISQAEAAPPGTVLQADKQAITVACGEGALSLLTLQPAGSKAMDTRAFLNGNSDWFVPGTRLGES